MWGQKQKQSERAIYSCANCGLTGYNESVYVIGKMQTWCIDCIVGLANIGLGYMTNDDFLVQKFTRLLKEREKK